jgi:hypothetical protein
MKDVSMHNVCMSRVTCQRPQHALNQITHLKNHKEVNIHGPKPTCWAGPICDDCAKISLAGTLDS